MRNSLKVGRFFLLQLFVLSALFPAQLALRTLQPTLRQARIIATAILALPSSPHRQQLWQQYREVLHSKIFSSLAALLASPQLPAEQQRQLCLCLAPTVTESEPETADLSASAVSRAVFVSSLLASARPLPSTALSVLFQSVLPTLLLDLPHCWPLISDFSPPSSGAKPEEHTPAPPSSPFNDLLDQICDGIFTLLSAILTSLPSVDPDASQPTSPPPSSADGVTAADVELFLWRSMGSPHPLCARLSTLLWARVLTGWDPSFRSHQLQLAVELLGMEQGEGVASVDAPVAPGRRVVSEWLACALPLFDAQQQQSLFDAMDVANVLLWYAASPPISLSSALPPTAAFPLYSSQSSSLTPTQVLTSSQPAFPPSQIPVPVSIHLLSHLHLPSLQPAVQASVCRSTLSAVIPLLLQCLTPAAISSTATLALVTVLLRVLDCLVQSADTFDAAFPTAQQRADELQPIILSLARLFSVPRAMVSSADGQTAQPPLFPTLLTQLSTSRAVAVPLLSALCSLLSSFLLHHVAFAPLLKILSGLASLLSTFPFLRLLLPPILVRLSSAPLMQQPSAPLAAAKPRQQLIAHLTALWHSILTPDPASSITSLTEAVAIPSFWAFTSALSSTSFADIVQQLLPPAHRATLIAQLTDHSQRTDGGAGVAHGDQEQRSSVYHWQARLLQQYVQRSEHSEQAATGGVDVDDSSAEGAAGAGLTVEEQSDSDSVCTMAAALAAVESVRRSRQAVLAVLVDAAPLADDERQRIQQLVEVERDKWLRLSP